MQNIVDDVSLRLTAAGSTRTDTVVLLRLDSSALERKVYTGRVQAHAASAGSLKPTQPFSCICTVVSMIQLLLSHGWRDQPLNGHQLPQVECREDRITLGWVEV